MAISPGKLEWHHLLLWGPPVQPARYSAFDWCHSLCQFGGSLRAKVALCHMANWVLQMFNNSYLPSSVVFEIYPTVIISLLWGHEWSKKCILVRSDNLKVVHVINKGRSNSATIMPFMCCLAWLSITHQFIFHVEHIPGYCNAIADSLSSFSFQTFRALAPYAEMDPAPIPPFSATVFCMWIPPSMSSSSSQKVTLNSAAPCTLSSYRTAWCSFRDLHQKFNLHFPTFNIATLSGFVSYAHQCLDFKIPTFKMYLSGINFLSN